MTRGTVDAIFEAGVRTGVSVPLKAAGFRKTRLLYHRERGDCVQVVGLQRSQGNGPARLRFYVDVGIGTAVLWRPPAQRCQVSRRLGELVPGAAAHYDLTLETDPAALAATLEAPLAALVGILDRVSTLDAMAALAPNDARLLAEIRYARGDDEGARAALEANAARFADRRGMGVEEVARRLGLVRLL